MDKSTGVSSVWSSPNGVYVVAEIGLNHNGDLDKAHALIDVAADASVDAVKFQKRDVGSLATSDVLEARDSRFPSLGSTYRELREKHEFDLSSFRELKLHSADAGVDFFVTPFDAPSLEFLDVLEVDRIKVASHSVTNLPLLQEVARRNLPVLCSTGMASMSEVDRAVEILSGPGSDLALLHCVSSYPTLPEDARLDLIGALKERFGVAVGYSGHEIGYFPTLLAVAAGATVVERHITLSTDLEGFDHRLSLDHQELSAMVEKIRSIETMFGGGPKIVTEKEKVAREKYQVSMVSAVSIARGERLGAWHITFKNPGTGIPPAGSELFFGREAVVDIPADTVLSPSHFVQ